ncbi:MAG: beta-ketoacyl synthase N-terminal-like domain-containing protein, partial [Myxococcota bacterium]
MTRVFVTGMGLITGLGTRVGECFDAVLRGETAARPVDRFVSEGFDVPVAAPADRARVLEEVGDSKLPFVSALIVHCARQALTQAGLSEPLGGIPLFVANTIGSPEASERPGGWSFADPAAPETVERYGQSPLVARAAEALGARGRVDVVGNTCAAGNYAIGLGLEEIRRGRAKRALVGGAEELSVLPFCAFSQLRAIGDPCRPFDRARNGMLFGEGGAMLVLESEESMRDRGAKPLAEVLAVGYSNDAYHLVAPDPAGRGLERALRQVLDNAPLSSIDYVNAHGTGTELNDAAEAQTLCRVFGTSISV